MDQNAVGMDEDHMGDPALLPREPRACFSAIGGVGLAAPRLSLSAAACASFRAVAVERPPYAR
jgi:hypothetical protein